MSDLLKLEKRGHVAIITLNNPPANTWTPESLNYLKQIVGELNVDKENYSLIITSDSEKFFSAGADLNRFNQQNHGLRMISMSCTAVIAILSAIT